MAPDVLELKRRTASGCKKDYVIVVDADVWIYDLHHMEKKVKWEKQGNVKKTLFLTEPNGKRHAILSTTKGMEDRKRLIRCIIDCMIGLLFSSSSWLTPVHERLGILVLAYRSDVRTRIPSLFMSIGQ